MWYDVDIFCSLRWPPSMSRIISAIDGIAIIPDICESFRYDLRKERVSRCPQFDPSFFLMEIEELVKLVLQSLVQCKTFTHIYIYIYIYIICRTTASYNFAWLVIHTFPTHVLCSWRDYLFISTARHRSYPTGGDLSTHACTMLPDPQVVSKRWQIKLYRYRDAAVTISALCCRAHESCSLHQKLMSKQPQLTCTSNAITFTWDKSDLR